jgi:DNA-binding transcriptional regulator YiaG
MLNIGEWRKAEDEADTRYREKYELMPPDEIRSLRERIGLTQADLADVLRVSELKVSRWETGRTVQSATIDALLRLIRDVPGSLEYLKKRAA